MNKFLCIILLMASCVQSPDQNDHSASRPFNSEYRNEYLNRVAFPIGGIGAGMFCLEGTGTISHVSMRNEPNIHNEPKCFSAISIKNQVNGTKVIEGPVPGWKIMSKQEAGNGLGSTTYGLPRFERAP